MAPFIFLLLLLNFPNIGADIQDPLPSWNEGPIKKAIIEFAQGAAAEGSTTFIPIEDRIAAFDQDGTLWVEKPLFAQFYFALDQLKKIAETKPEIKKEPPFNYMLNGDMNALENISDKDLGRLLEFTLTNMTVESYRNAVAEWLKTALHPRFKRPFTQLVYQPMLEVIRLLKEHQFKIYISSGGGQEFIRAYAENLYGIPIDRVIGTTNKIQYEYRSGSPALVMLPELLFINTKDVKVESINLIIGKKPTAAFGNSGGDKEMLEWTQSGATSNLELLIHHDDAAREYLYRENERFGRLTESLIKEAKAKGWLIASMKNDWKVVFPWEQPPAENKLRKEELQFIEISSAYR